MSKRVDSCVRPVALEAQWRCVRGAAQRDVLSAPATRRQCLDAVMVTGNAPRSWMQMTESQVRTVEDLVGFLIASRGNGWSVVTEIRDSTMDGEGRPERQRIFVTEPMECLVPDFVEVEVVFERFARR